MSKRFKFLKVITVALCFILVFTTLVFDAGTLFAQDDGQDGASLNEEGGAGPDDPPGDGTEDPPGDGTEDPPGEEGEGTEDPPIDGTEELPGAGAEDPPGAGIEVTQNESTPVRALDKVWNQENVSAMYGPATAWGTSYAKLSDNDTSNSAAVFSPTTLENGRFWVDKSVNNDTAVILKHDGTPLSAPIQAAPDQFLVTLSALGEAYSVDTVVPPVDAVFILDLSGSMTYNVTNNNAGSVGNRRIDQLVNALNMAIKMLMDANPANRVAVVGYGGLAGREPRSYNILDLGYYETGNGAGYFNVGGSTTVAPGTPLNSIENVYLNVNNSLIKDGTATGTILSNPIGGGTPTQKGIYAGSQVLMNNNDKTFTDPNSNVLPRKPVMVLITDGEPTFAWTDYIALTGDYDTSDPTHSQEWGDALTPDMGISLLTVATASYWKQQVSDWYYSATDPGKNIDYFTIGLGPVTTMPHARAVLDPQAYASGSQTVTGGNTYNMATLLASFLSSGTITFPVLVRTLGTALSTTFGTATITNTASYIKSCFFPTRYFPASNAAALEDAFKTIAQQIITQGRYLTDVEDPRGANYSGYLTFSDVLGQYMEFKSVQGAWYEGTSYNNAAFISGITNTSNTAYWDTTPSSESFAVSLAEQIDEKKVGGVKSTMSPQDAVDLINSNILGGAIAVGRISWYADADKYYLGSYYTAAGVVAPAPAGAMCRMDLYPIAAAATDYVTGQPTNLWVVSFAVLTALKDGSFNDADDSYMGITARSLKKDQQIVRWYIPASMIPMRTVDAEFGTGAQANEIISADIVEAEPIRAVYSVGLKGSLSDPLDFSTIDSAYKKLFRKTPAGKVTTGYPARYHFYTNQYNLANNETMVFCGIDSSNQYYFYLDPDNPKNNRVPLYTLRGTDYIPATSTSGTLYVKEEYFDLSAPDYIGVRYVAIDKSKTPASVSGSPAMASIASGQVRGTANTYSKNKTQNITTTKAYVENVRTVRTSTMAASTSLVQQRLLGNNGTFYVPVTQVRVQKRWYNVPREPIQVQLFTQAGTQAFDVPVTLSSANNWRYTWYSDARELFVYSPLYAASATNGDNVVFQDYSVKELFPGGVQPDYPWSITGPEYNANNNSWTLAIINNGTPTDPPPTNPPPRGGNAETGDQTDLLLWWMLLCIAVLGLCFIYKAGEYYRIKRRRTGERQ